MQARILVESRNQTETALISVTTWGHRMGSGLVLMHRAVGNPANGRVISGSPYNSAPWIHPVTRAVPSLVFFLAGTTFTSDFVSHLISDCSYHSMVTLPTPLVEEGLRRRRANAVQRRSVRRATFRRAPDGLHTRRGCVVRAPWPATRQVSGGKPVVCCKVWNTR